MERRWFAGLVVGVVSMLSAAVAGAQEPGEKTPSAAPPAATSPPPEPPPRPKVAIRAEMLGRLVVVTTHDRSLEGKLIALNDDELVVQTYSQQEVTVERTAVLSARLLSGDGDLLVPVRATPWRAPPARVTPWSAPPSRAAVDDAPSPWGVWLGLAVGPAWGQRTGSATPNGTFALDIAVSYHFVYAGTGFGLTWFGGAGTFSNETTGGTLESGAPISFSGYIEAGLTKGLFIPYSATEAVELRPGVGYGLWGMTAAHQGIGDCEDCDSRSFDYNGAHYVRFQLGVYHSKHPEGSVVHRVFMSRNGFFMGGTVSLQEFVFGGGPRLNRVLTFAYTGGWGP